MIYHGTQITETIWVGPENDLNDACCVDLIKDCEEPVFYVTSCSNTDWVWRFHMEGESNYEMIKHTIIDTVFECKNMIELMDELDGIFAEDFSDIVAWDEEENEHECNCENCNHRNCLN